jgi:imidazolonepropionase-like amidohydrolase
MFGRNDGNDLREMSGAVSVQCVYGQTVYTGYSVVSDAHVVFDGTTVVGLSHSRRGRLCGEFAVITPAFIDPHNHIGMERAGEPSDQGETNEHMDSLITLADALDSVQMDDSAFRDAVETGVLYSCVMPGSGNIIGGQSAVIRNFARDGTTALVGRAGLKAAFGFNPMSTRSWQGKRPTTRMGAVALLRSKLNEVRDKQERRRRAKGPKKQEITFSAEDRVLLALMEGKTRLRAHVHKIDDICALLRLADEFGLSISVEHAMGVHRPEIFDELRRRGIPVVYGPVDAFAYKVELKHENWRNIRHLIESGVDFGLMTDHPVVLARQLFLQTRWFLRSGLTRQQAIELVSRRNAHVLGVDDRLGSLERDKWASFVCWPGDPFTLDHHPVAVYAEGALVFSE